MRWWISISTKNYTISSSVIIKTPRTCNIKCYSKCTIHTVFFFAMFSYNSFSRQAILKFKIISRIAWPGMETINNKHLHFCSSNCFTLLVSLSIFIPILYAERFMLCKKALYNGLSLELYTSFDFQLRTQSVPCFLLQL